jgi:hypothetical protein
MISQITLLQLISSLIEKNSNVSSQRNGIRGFKYMYMFQQGVKIIIN